MKDLFAIFIRPQRTIDNLLFDRNMARSWKASWWLTLISSVGSLVYFGVVLSQDPAMSDLLSTEGLDAFSGGVFWLVMAIGWVLITALSFGMMALMRLLFSWFVRVGLRISAGEAYPSDPTERREKGKLLQLIHPYTLSLQIWPSLILSLTFSFLLRSLVIDPQHLAANPEASHLAGKLILLIVFDFLVLLIGLGSYVYLIIARVIAIRKIYNLSAARAFWGPFLIYFLFTVIPYVALFMFLIIVGIMNAAVNHNLH